VDTPTSVDRNAPVLAHHEIDISAPVSRVWALHQDVNTWPAWQFDITAAQLNGAFAPGGSFTWTSFGFTVTSTVYAVQDTPGSCGAAPAMASPACTNGYSRLHRPALTQRPPNPSPALPSRPT
jgi:hypothetical protein